MNVLFVGAGKGSWEMRGLQMAAALRGTATSSPTAAHWAWADVAVLVKRHGMLLASQPPGSRVPVVWDALDFWSQPADNLRSEDQFRTLLRSHIAAVRPAAVIGATMAQAYAANGTYIPHHSWAGLEPTDARKDVQVVAYQGSPAYLGQWMSQVSSACVSRGWRFEINPRDLSSVDILVAFRDGPWDGWACREWKSGVKLVNAIAAGRPIIGQPTAARREILPPGSVIEHPSELDAALDYWTPQERRQAAVEECRGLARSYTIASVADQYGRILDTVRATCAAAR